MNLSATQDTNLFIRQYAKLSQATQKAAFETRFHSIQSGLLNDLNNNRPLRFMLPQVFKDLPVPPYLVAEWRTLFNSDSDG